MVRRLFPAVGALALLFGSAGTSSAQALFLPVGFGNPVFGYGAYNGYGGYGYYPGGIGFNYLPRTYGAFTGYGPVNTGVSTFATNPYYNNYNARLAAQATYFGMGAPAPSYASYMMPSTSYVAFAPRSSGNITAVAYSGSDLAAQVEVQVPPDAELWFDGHKTSQSGPTRMFHTPALDRGQGYRYTVKARWTEDGKPFEQTQTVRVSAGARVRVIFPKSKE
jgi:uncharacterized protein (TIGR03000 family)